MQFKSSFVSHAMSDDIINEKWSIDFKVIFHFLCHAPFPLLTQLMKSSGFRATNIEKFRTLCIPIKSANDSDRPKAGNEYP